MGKLLQLSREERWVSGYFKPEGKAQKNFLNRKVRRNQNVPQYGGYKKGTISFEWS